MITRAKKIETIWKLLESPVPEDWAVAISLIEKEDISQLIDTSRQIYRGANDLLIKHMYDTGYVTDKKYSRPKRIALWERQKEQNLI